ncbi:MAG: hypothetical protein ACXWOT_09950 [Candidatus Limnocylindrales bacterium]
MNEAAVTARIAHLHLRTGLPALARVELEALAGRGELGAPAWADLAEARWRGGDLSGAADAARVHLDQGGDEVLAEVVVIESLAAAGDHRDARRLAQRVLARADVDEAALDRVFAGHPRSSAWPGRHEFVPAPAASAPAAPRSAPGTPSTARPSDDLAAAEAALDRDDALAAAGLLGVVLREEPALAAMTLSVAERGLAATGPTGPAAAALQLVRGDALRLLGRAGEASAAFQGSRRALVDAAPREEAT